ncbi:MAG: trimethylamine-N-oxide reductase TorA [Rhodospirillaceae bacterium]|nr:trimethylamine-N-oxide reductase TorA [Rhodospirillaceae bacterium]
MAAVVPRRTFLKGSAAAALGTLAGPSLLAHAATRGPILDVLQAQQGSHWGPFVGRVEGGRFVQAIPNPEDPFPSSLTQALPDSVYSPARVKYPMVREGFLNGGAGANPEERGRGNFVRVSWDEALDLVAGEIQRVKDTYGNEGFFTGSYGWKSVGRLHNCHTVMQRLFNLIGGSVIHSGDYSTGASQVIMPHVVGSLEVYEQQTVWPVILENTQLVVVWGADPLNTNKIDWVMCDHGGIEGFRQLKEAGIPVICIDPVQSHTAVYMGAELIQPRPQTDMAMMLGVAYALYDEGLHDQAFLDDYTTGFDQFLAYLKGDSDGTPKTPAWASEICGVPAETIAGLARRFAENRTMLMSGWSMQRAHHGEQVHWMLVTLASMLGQIGLPGGGFGLSYHYSNGGWPASESPVLPGITAAGSGAAGAAWLATGGVASIPVARVVDMLENPGGTFQFNGNDVTYPPVKMIYWVGGNPFSHHQQRNRMVAAWQKPETIVVHECYWTATAKHADIVLPATTSYERNDIEQGGSYTNRFMVGMHKLVDPLYESRSDFEIFTGIAEKMGLADTYTEGKAEMDWIRGFYEAALEQAQNRSIEMPDFDTFWNGDSFIDFPTSERTRSFVRYSDFRGDPLLSPLGTPSGKIEIYSRTIEGFGYDDCPPHPTWMEPVERLGGAGSDKYPLHVTTGHPDDRLHSQLAHTWLRDRYTVQGREPVWIHPDTAAARGIADGDIVRVHNDRGQVLAGAIVTDRVRPDVLRLSEGGWYDPQEGGEPGTLCKYGDVNVLSIDIGTSKLAQGNCGHTILAEVEKFEGEPPRVTAFEPPLGG